MIEIRIYTDGACSGNPGPGGWGVVMKATKENKLVREKELSGGEPETTNNRMELTAAIEGIKTLSRPAKCTIITDSKYLMDGLTKWLPKWRENNWKNSKNKDIKNQDLWKKIELLSSQHKISWEWVKGHNSHPGNEKADFLARKGMGKFKI